jgi:hypothetical protein
LEADQLGALARIDGKLHGIGIMTQSFKCVRYGYGKMIKQRLWSIKFNEV